MADDKRSPPNDPEVYEETMMGRRSDQMVQSPIERFAMSFFSIFDTPVTWFREAIVVPNRPKTVYYHRKFPRVPTIDECYTDDLPCMFEANEQFKRDRKVDNKILDILRTRMADCYFYHGIDEADKCKPLEVEYTDSLENWFIKYGDLCMYNSVADAYMKQKHRMVFERRRAAKQAQDGNSA